MIQVILGLLLALFIPGYLLARIFFKDLSELEKVALAFVLSIALDIFLGLFLGYNEQMKNLTGGITEWNLWIYLSSMTGFLLVVYALVNRKEISDIIWKQKEFRIRRSVAHHEKKHLEYEKRGKLE